MISLSSCQLTDAEVSAAIAVLKSGRLRAGAAAAEFEAAFARLVGAGHAVAVSSGTAALHAAYLATLGPGDEVLVPAMTFTATAAMLLAVGAVPIFCDVDPGTWLIDLQDAARRVTPRTRAIVPVHLFGNPCRRDEVQSFAARRGLSVIWDAAQAHGARQAGVDVGGWPSVVCYSLYATKNLFTGEGGMVCTPDGELAEAIRRRCNHGMDSGGNVVELGFNYRITEAQAAIGLAQLGRFAAMQARRRRNAERLAEGLARTAGLHVQATTDSAEHGWHHFCVRVDARAFGMTRDQLAAELGRRGISTAFYYRQGVHHHPLFRASADRRGLPIADLLSEQVIALPVHHDLTDTHVAAVIDAVRAARDTAAP